MRYMTPIGLTCLVAAALMAFIGGSTASATVLNGSGGKLGAGTRLDFSLSPATALNLTDTEAGTIDQCFGSTISSEITIDGGAAATVTGSNIEITWTSCSYPTKTLTLGKLEIHYTSGTSGTLTADGEIAVTINTIFFGSCVYGVTAGTDLGTLTGGNPATFHVKAVTEKLSGSNLVCPPTAVLTGTYLSTSPSGTLDVAAS